MIELRHSDTKPLFVRGPSLAMRLFIVVAICLVTMFVDYRHQHLERIRAALSVLVYPIRAMVDAPFGFVSWLDTRLQEREGLLDDNQTLREQKLLDQVRLQRLSALEAENQRLRALLDSTSRVPDRVLVSEIMAVDLDPRRHRIALDKGLRHGAFRGQALLDAQGIVGQITRADPLSSEAILISDPDHALPVELNRNGLRTIAVGTGVINRLSLPFLPNNADIHEGDLLVTSGLGGSFPAGYPVGKVLSVERDPQRPFAVVEATPEAALDRAREVLLVWSGTYQEQAADALAISDPDAAGQDEAEQDPRP